MKVRKLVMWVMVAVLMTLPSAQIFAQETPPPLYLPHVTSSASEGSTAETRDASADAVQIAAQDPNSPLSIALAFVREHRAAWGLTAGDIADMVVTDYYTTQHNGVSHIYLRQRLQGIEVFNGNLQVNVLADGSILNFHNDFVPNLARAANTLQPAITPVEATTDAARHLGLTIPQALTVIANVNGPAQAVQLNDGGISRRNIPVELVFAVDETNGTVRLAWNVSIDRKDRESWRHLRVDAVTGEVLDENDWVAFESYRVFPSPLESPQDGVGLPNSHSLVSNPADLTASPFGWHDTDGVVGAEFNDTRGNNVSAQEDVDASDSGGSRPAEVSVGALDFDYAFDATLAPNAGTNLQAATVNLFYQNNVIHDILYHYGFDEASGNFQENNYGNGGLAGDPVQADVQDGIGTNNANFGTPPDGEDPRMQMFVWTLTTPDRDSDFDNGVIIHEYAHGLSTRLTGGPANSSCLSQAEQMGEGWSDFVTLVLTAKPGDTATQARGIGTYVLGEPPNGPGIRVDPYSTDMVTNPQTYDFIKFATPPHGVGAVWAEMLWEMYWGLVNQYGFDANLYTGTGGNNLALQLVIDGMKLQPCNPGFVDGRDAILLADQAKSGGENECLIWEAFAKRGLGFSAVQGSSNLLNDGTQAFDLPESCQADIQVTKTASEAQVYPGKVFTYTLKAFNRTGSLLTGVVITDALPAELSYVANSASNGGSEAGGIVTWNVGTLQVDEVVTRTFRTQVDLNAPSVQIPFSDDMESGSGKWSATGLWHQEDGTGNCDNSQSPTTSWYYGSAAVCTYNTGAANSGSLTTNSPIAIPANAESHLTLWSWEKTEGGGGFDTRTLSLSTDGVAFSPIYDSTNNSATWYQVSQDLSAYAGMNVWLRFDFDTVDNQDNSYKGWYIDDVKITSRFSFTNTAYVSSNEDKSDTGTWKTTITLPPTPTVVDDNTSTDEDTAVLIDILANDTDPDNNPLSVASVTQPNLGTVTNQGTHVTYTPDANVNGLDTFTYVADNGVGGAATATVTVTVNPVDDAPQAVVITGPSSGVVGQEYTFTATTSIVVLGNPGAATQAVAPAAVFPLTYTWQATNHQASEQTGEFSASKSFVWTSPGTKTISLVVANAMGQTSAERSIMIAAGAPANVTVTVAPTSLPANGTSTSDVTATIRDEFGNPLANQPINFTTSLGSITASALTNGAGVAQATLTAASTPGTATVTASAGSVSGTAQAAMTLVVGAPVSVTVTASPVILPANGTSTSAITATVKDEFGNLLANQPVDFTTTLGTMSAVALTDAEGVAHATLTSTTTISTATVSAQAGEVFGTVAVEFLGGAIRGVVFHDKNSNGTQDTGEPGIAGVTVSATLEPQASRAMRGDAAIAQSTPQTSISNGDGEYRFADLVFGQYRITMTLPPGYSFVTTGSLVVDLASTNGTDLPTVTARSVGVARLMFVPSVQK